MADRSLKVVITGDASNAEAAFRNLGNVADESGLKVEKFGTSATNAHGKTQELGTVAEETGKKFQNELHRGVDDISNALSSQLGPAAGVANTALQTVGEKILSASGAMKVAGGAAIVGGAAILGLGAYALESVGKWAALGESVLQFERVSGTSAEEASRLIYVMGELGISSDTASAAMFKMTRADPGKLHDLGVEIAYNADGSQNLAGTLDRVRVAYQATEDPVKRNLILFDAFGKAGQALAPYLALSAEQLRIFNDEAAKHHAIFTEDEVNKAHEYTLATRNMSAAMEGFGYELAQIVIPALTATISGVTSLTEGVDHSIQTVTKSKEAHAGLATALSVLGTAWSFGSKSAEGFGMSLVNTTLGPLKAIGAGANEAGKGISDAAGAISLATGIHINFAGALSSVGHGLSSLIPGLDNATKSTQKHSEVLSSAQLTANALKQAEIDATGGIYTLSAAAVDNVEKMGKNKGATEGLAQAAKDLKKDEDALAKAVASFIDPMAVYTDAIKKQATADESAAKAAGLSAAQQKFSQDDWIAHTHVTTAQYLADLTKQVQDQTNWQNNMVLLAQRASAGTLQYLAELGPKGAPLVAQLVNASDAEMTRMNVLMDQKSQSATDTVAANIKNAKPLWDAVMTQGGQSAVDSLTAQLKAGTITVEQISQQYGVNLASGINPILTSLGKAAIDMGLGHQGGMYAAGGMVNGPGGPRDDRVPILASNGEFVVNAKATENNRAALEWMNASKFAYGGYVDGAAVPHPPSTNPFRLPISTAADDVMQREYDEAVKWVNENAGGGDPAIKAWIQAQSGKPYIWGGAGPGGYDCSGFTGAVYGAMTHQGYGQGQRYFTTLSDFHALGFKDGPGGTYTIGVSPSHMDGRYGGLPFEAGHTPIVAGSGAQNTANFPRQYHMGGDGPGQGVGAGSGGLWLGDSGTPAGGAKGYAQSVLNSMGIGDQFGAVDFIFTNESGWDPFSVNPSSGAAGIAQSLGHGAVTLGDWKSQVDWGINYMDERYGSPNAAAAFWRAHNWYDQGGILPPGTSLATNATGQNEYVLNADQMAGRGGSTTINLNFTGPMYADRGGIRTLARQVADEVANAQRQNGRPITTASVF